MQHKMLNSQSNAFIPSNFERIKKFFKFLKIKYFLKVI